MRRFLTPGRLFLAAFLGLLLLGLAAWYAPEINAEPLRAPVARALARTIGRPVEFRELQYQIVPAPGIKLLDLVIPEDPQFGREPIAYVTEMQVGVSWRSLLSRSLQVSSVVLVDSSLNLALQGTQGWNVVRLLRQMKASVEAAGAMPAVELSACRVNFRSGLRKSSYFLNNVDLELDSRGAGFAWVFEASPARTDRAEQGFGRFTGEGRWTATPAGDGALDIQIELEPSALSEVTQFLAGRDLGLQGRLASRVRLGGSPQSLQLTGNIELAGLDRPALFGLRQPELGLPIEGSLDVQKQSLQVRTAVAKPDQSAPFAIEFNAVRLFSQPDWTTQAQFDGLPAPTFLDLARKLGSRVPAGLGVEGKLSGKVLLAASSGLDGELTLREGSVRLGAAGPLSIPEALVRLSGAQVELEECAVATLAGNQAKVRGVWSADSESLDFHAETEQLDMEELTAAMSSLPGVPPLPLLGECEKGSVAGAIEFHRGLPEDEAAGQWLGELQLKGLACPVPGATRPLILQRADLSFRKGGWLVRRAQGDWAGLPFTGEASSQPAARRSFRFSLQMPDARWEQLEALLEPALRRRRSLLERTLPFRRSSPPSWLAGRHAEGRFEFGSLQVGETVWNSVKGSLFWDGSQFEIPHLSASAREARLEGRLQLSLAADQPVYRLLGNLTNWPWLGGAIDADLDLLARGFGPALGAGLRVSGNFHALRSALPDLPLRSFDGAYDFDAARRPSPLKLSALRAETASGETLTGAASSGDGQLILELAAPNRAPRRLPLPLLSLFPSGESPPAR